MHYFFLILLLPFFSQIDAKINNLPLETIQVKGILEAKNGFDAVPEQVIRFKGQETRNDSKGFFTFLVTEPTQYSPPPTPSILICKNDTVLIENKNTPQMLKPREGKSYKYFVFENNEWKEKELLDHSQNNNCVTILMDPALVETVVPWEVEFEKVVRMPVLKLPKIILKSDVPEKKKTDVSFKSLSSSWDSAKLYKPVEITKLETINERGGKTVRTLAQ